MTSIKQLFATNTLWIALLLATTFLIYQPGLYGDYLFDDLTNITTNTSLEIHEFSWSAIRDAAISSFSGPLKRPVSMLSFAFNASTTGLGAPLYFKLTGLLIHLITGLAVFWLARLLIARFRTVGGAERGGPDWVSLLVTAIWLLHPLNLTTVLYVVQRMTSLSALFAFLGVAVYCVARQRMDASKPHAWTLIALVFLVLLPLSALSKENGVLIPVLLLVVELTAFNYKMLGRSDRLRLGVLGLFTVAIPVALVLAAVMMNHPRLMASYQVREFDVWERMLTQGRVIWFYVAMTVLPNNSKLGLYHDDFTISTTIFSPMSTAFAWTGIAGLIMLAILARRRLPVVSFGVLWFFAGHLMESTVLPLEMVHEHRNYLPIFGPIFAACFLFVEWVRGGAFTRWAATAAVAYLLLLGAATFFRAEQWGDTVAHTLHEVENHPNSERAQLQAGRLYMRMMIDTPRAEYYVAAKEALEKSIRLATISVTSHFALIQLSFLMNQPADPAVVDAAVRVLSNGPMPPSVAPAFRALVDCQIFAYCKLPDRDVLRLGNAALANPGAIVGITTQVAIYLTQYQIDKMGDGDLAIKTLRDALARDPNSVALHLTAGKVFRVVREFEQAKLQLDQASQLDSLGTYKTGIAEEMEKWKRDVALSRQ
jgi:hypothetical protein